MKAQLCNQCERDLFVARHVALTICALLNISGLASNVPVLPAGSDVPFLVPVHHWDL